MNPPGMLVCSPHMGLNPESSLGGEIYEHNLLGQLATRGVDFLVSLPASKQQPPIEGITYFPVHQARGRYLSCLFTGSVLRLYRRYRFDLLRIPSALFMALPAVVFAGLHPRVPIVLHHHHLDPGLVARATVEGAVRASDAVITVSEYSKERLAELLPSQAPKIHVIHNGISDFYRKRDVPSSFLAERGLAGKQVVLYVGALRVRKHLVFLLEAFATVLSRVPSAHLVFVGDGVMREALAATCARLGIGRSVHFAGFVDDETKLDWLNAASVFVSPSLLEGFGLNVAEAMACGLPVVTSDRTALPEVVGENYRTGVVAPVTDPRSFARPIVELLTDAGLRARIGAAARDRVAEQFRWDTAAAQTLAVYQELVERAGHRAPARG